MGLIWLYVTRGRIGAGNPGMGVQNIASAASEVAVLVVGTVIDAIDWGYVYEPMAIPAVNGGWVGDCDTIGEP